jgi:hypothetical protein
MEPNLEAVIQSAVADIDGSDASAQIDSQTDAALDGGGSVDDQSGGADPMQVAGQQLEQQVADPLADDPLAKELGLKTRADGKENRIPYSRVKMITANAEKKARAELLQQVAEAHGVDVKTLDPAKLKDYLGGREQSFSAERAEVSQMREVEKIMTGDPDRFMAILAETNPAYKKFLTGSGGLPDAGKTALADLEMPAPDFDMGNGVKTYSLEGMQNALKWAVAEGKRQAVEDSRKVVDEGLRPIRETQESAVRQQQQQESAKLAWRAACEELDGFRDHQEEILALLKSDTEIAIREKRRPMSLERAYAKVVPAKLKADREKVRAEVIAEARKKTVTGTSAGTETQAGAQAVNANPSTEDIIKNAIRNLAR